PRIRGLWVTEPSKVVLSPEIGAKCELFDQKRCPFRRCPKVTGRIDLLGPTLGRIASLYPNATSRTGCNTGRRSDVQRAEFTNVRDPLPRARRRIEPRPRERGLRRMRTVCGLQWFHLLQGLRTTDSLPFLHPLRDELG